MSIIIIVITFFIALSMLFLAHWPSLQHRYAKTIGVKAVAWLLLFLLVVDIYHEIHVRSANELDAAKKSASGIIEFGEFKNDKWIFEIGQSGALLSGLDASDWLGENCYFRSTRGQLLVTCVIRDELGNIVAKIVDNEWQVNQNNIFDRNFSDNAFEVVSQAGDVVFQMRAVKNRLQVQLNLYNKNGDLLYVGTVKRPGSRADQGVVLKGKNALRPLPKIGPIFRYPSSLHFGELLEQTSD